jgi:hypothetical protein
MPSEPLSEDTFLIDIGALCVVLLFRHVALFHDAEQARQLTQNLPVNTELVRED